MHLHKKLLTFYIFLENILRDPAHTEGLRLGLIYQLRYLRKRTNLVSFQLWYVPYTKDDYRMISWLTKIFDRYKYKLDNKYLKNTVIQYSLLLYAKLNNHFIDKISYTASVELYTYTTCIFKFVCTSQSSTY